MHVTAQKEQFSLAFVHAIASVAGFKLKTCTVDDDSIDVDIAGNRGFGGTTFRAPHVGVQAKCTETDDGTGEDFPFTLSIKNYDDLRDELVHYPRILVVHCVPVALDEWLHEAPEHSAIRRIAYWMSLRGLPPAPGQESKTVRIRRSNRFNVESLKAIMSRIADGGLP